MMFYILFQNSFPDSTGYSISNSYAVCLDALLMYVNHMVDRLQTEVFDYHNILEFSNNYILDKVKCNIQFKQKGSNNSFTCGLSWDKMTATDYNSELRPTVF